ncbi:efflux RND transporter permease subunit [Ancylobacter defluvii]|uniref:Cation efflux system protein n=1 Tax=Ancylobacter defluvii TaxID=1282440 RepID=A0A9W6N9M0_9HYPH|nr:efflux RND transporter permease subunit [Ancylobacter defluvii]MBS7587243.1 efflux RND transporter permease subunit [Ancylobacter defluvii]GLK83559.1 cation efflux system protein [Ancylobacter defluvii]
MGRFNLSRWAVEHRPLVLFMIIAIAIAGAVSFQRLGRSEDPNFTVKVAVLTAVWPGATAREMQDQVADLIEKKLQELPHFDRVQTYVKPSFTAMQITFRDDTLPAEVPGLFYQIRKKMDDVRPSLPAGVIGPSVNDEYGDVDSILTMLTGDGVDYAQLKKVADALRQRLLKVPGVAKVNIYGVQQERIFVEFSHAKLATLGVTPQAIFDSLSRQNDVTPAGTVETDARRIPLRVTGALDGVKAVAETPVESGGRTFRLGDIATVTRGFIDPPDFLVRQRGQPALGVGVVMARGANILKFGEDVLAETRAFQADVPQGVSFEQIADQPEIVEESIWEFERSFVEALAIVLGVSFLSLGWRTGIVVALSVPLVLSATFVVMYTLGMDLHRITLGALIIALGLLVDDAIIAVEMMVVKMEQGYDRMEAAAFAWTSTAFPMLTGTAVTVAGFLPVGFAKSAAGEYAGGIFWVVGIALAASWIVAVVFTPYLGVMLLPSSLAKAGAHGDHDAIYQTRLYRGLRAAIRTCVRWRITTVAITVALFFSSVVGFGLVQQQFFPLSERKELFLQLRLPEGSSIGATTRIVTEAEKLIGQSDPDIQTFTAYVGQGSPRFWLGLNPTLPNEAFAEIVILTRSIDGRERVKTRLETAIGAGALAQARARVDRFSFGPPVGFPVQFRVIGPDPMKVREIAYRVRDALRTNPNTIDPHLDWNEMSPSVRLVVDQERARALGLNVQDVAQTLQTLVSGLTVTTVRDGIEQVGVVARAVESERLDLGHVGDLTIVARNGVAVPLSQVARLDYVQEDPILWRRNRDTVITVRADVADGVQPPDVTARTLPLLQPIKDSLEPGYRIETGGAVEESEKANAALFVIFPIMFLAMLTLLMLQLQSFSRLALVFMTAPLGLIGTAAGLLIAQKPFGFVALLGVIALAGMIMRNTLILVDQIESDVASGSHTRGEAIVEATVRRARPVVLTALAAILAMIPLSSSAFWSPMAVTIMGGLFVATFLTILFLPALYALWFRNSLDARGVPPEPARAGAQASARPVLAAEGHR